MYPLLDKFGASDLGLRFQLQTDAPPSFGYWMAQNATTLFEYWTNSQYTSNGGLNSYVRVRARQMAYGIWCVRVCALRWYVMFVVQYAVFTRCMRTHR